MQSWLDSTNLHMKTKATSLSVFSRDCKLYHYKRYCQVWKIWKTSFVLFFSKYGCFVQLMRIFWCYMSSSPFIFIKIRYTSVGNIYCSLIKLNFPDGLAHTSHRSLQTRLGSTHQNLHQWSANGQLGPESLMSLLHMVLEQKCHKVSVRDCAGTMCIEKFKADWQSGRRRCVWLWDFADSLQRQPFYLFLLGSLRLGTILG